MNLAFFIFWCSLVTHWWNRWFGSYFGTKWCLCCFRGFGSVLAVEAKNCTGFWEAAGSWPNIFGWFGSASELALADVVSSQGHHLAAGSELDRNSAQAPGSNCEGAACFVLLGLRVRERSASVRACLRAKRNGWPCPRSVVRGFIGNK